MSIMKYEEAKKAFELGAVEKAMIVESFMEEGWNMLLKIKGRQELTTIITQRGEVKKYKTLDSAGNEVARLGLANFEVILQHLTKKHP